MADGLVGVILAAEDAWGRCALRHVTPCSIAPIANRPLIVYALQALRGLDIHKVEVSAPASCTRLGKIISSLVGDDFQISLRDDDHSNGPADCVRDAAANDAGAHVVVFDAHAIPHFNVRAIIDGHLASGAALTLAARRTTVADYDTYHPAGVCVLSPDAIALIQETGFADIKRGLIPRLREQGRAVRTHAVDGCTPYLRDVASYFALNDWAMRRAAEGSIELEGYVVRGDALIHIDAHVDGSARLLGPVIVGPGAVVQAQAILSGPTSVGSESVVGERAVIARSAIWADVKIGANAHVDACLVAEGERIAKESCVKQSIVLRRAETHGSADVGSRRLKAERHKAVGETETPVTTVHETRVFER